MVRVFKSYDFRAAPQPCFPAFSTFLLAMGVAVGTILRFGPESFTFIYDKWIGFVTASFIMSVVQSVYCYASSFFGDKLLALGGNSGNFIYDVSFRSV